MTKRKQMALKTREKIYESALKVINEKGYNNVNIEDITTEANVAKGSFYTYFDSKADIIFYNIQMADEQYERIYQQVEDECFSDMLMDFIRIAYTKHEDHGKGIIKAMISNFFSFPEYNFISRDRTLLRVLKKIVEKGKLENQLRDDIPSDHYVEELIVALLGAETLWCFDETGRSLVDIVDNAVRLTMKGISKV
ncbi:MULTISPECIES: TetR/AcrR family transcriptional regulator [Oscillospiraceae]|uniref:TetR/AcrR family transcriptional regulator n=1 Tax=Oscillospiraceae TaxID=216572 RepID=UPI001F06FF84|nr:MULTISPECIES: TetR/AcrR family transcriptional regulator [Oscillospiraceae]MCH1982242.1 TetR/AcrR family transcriptional regulator [Ruminococcus sp. OA3]